VGWRRELRGAKSFGDGDAVNGRNVEKKVWEAEYSAWDILRGSEEKAIEIFDLLGTLGRETKICQAEEVGPSSLECEGLAIRR